MAVKLEMGRLLHLEATIPDSADRIVEETARELEGEAKANASGRPGPEVQSGELRGGITVETSGPARRKIGPTSDYGIFIELGTRHNRPYPFLMPAFESVAPKLKTRIKGIVE